MEENKKTKEIKIGLKTFIKFIILIAIIIIIAVLVMTQNKNNENSEDYEKVSIIGTTYYHRLTSSTWSGEYHQEEYYTGTNSNVMEVVSYEQYLLYIYEINSEINELNDNYYYSGIYYEEISDYYTDSNSNYIILKYSNGYSWCRMDLIDCIENDDKIIIYGEESNNGIMSSGSGYFIAIPTDMPIRNGNRI